MWSTFFQNRSETLDEYMAQLVFHTSSQQISLLGRPEMVAEMTRGSISATEQRRRLCGRRGRLLFRFSRFFPFGTPFRVEEAQALPLSPFLSRLGRTKSGAWCLEQTLSDVGMQDAKNPTVPERADEISAMN